MAAWVLSPCRDGSVKIGTGGAGAAQAAERMRIDSFTSSDQPPPRKTLPDADDAGSKIDAYQVTQYDWKADGSHQDYGMIAQELNRTVAPELLVAMLTQKK